jgi:hypothetical protein
MKTTKNEKTKRLVAWLEHVEKGFKCIGEPN